jgi:hypothetical protein
VDLVRRQVGGGRKLQTGVVIGLAVRQPPHAAVAVRHDGRLLLHLGQRRQNALVAPLPFAGQGRAALTQQPVLPRTVASCRRGRVRRGRERLAPSSALWLRMRNLPVIGRTAPSGAPVWARRGSPRTRRRRPGRAAVDRQLGQGDDVEALVDRHPHLAAGRRRGASVPATGRRRAVRTPRQPRPCHGCQGIAGLGQGGADGADRVGEFSARKKAGSTKTRDPPASAGSGPRPRGRRRGPDQQLFGRGARRIGLGGGGAGRQGVQQAAAMTARSGSARSPAPGVGHGGPGFGGGQGRAFLQQVRWRCRPATGRRPYCRRGAGD